jgi:hypothetical protein
MFGEEMFIYILYYTLLYSVFVVVFFFLLSFIPLLLAFTKNHFKTLGDRSFTFSAVDQWNVLPLQLRARQSLSTFKEHLKTCLFKRSYPNS